MGGMRKQAVGREKKDRQVEVVDEGVPDSGTRPSTTP